MDSGTDSGPSFDLVAASIRADARDLATFLEALAYKLGEALPGAVAVEREGGLFRRQHRVRRLHISLGDRSYELERAAAGLRCQIAHSVRGITVKSEEIELDAWIDDLSRRLAEHAVESSRARLALERLLG